MAIGRNLLINIKFVFEGNNMYDINNKDITLYRDLWISPTDFYFFCKKTADPSIFVSYDIICGGLRI